MAKDRARELAAAGHLELKLLWTSATTRPFIARIVRHGRSITFQMAEVMVPRDLFQTILGAIAALRPLPPARC
jgi:hypothetical protein